MNIETFVHNIQNITSEGIIEAFDKVLALYSLYNGVASEYDNIQISKTGENEAASFDIIFEDSHYAQVMHGCCDGLSIRLYNEIYTIASELDDATVHIILQ